MKHWYTSILIFILLLLSLTMSAYAGFFDDLTKGLGFPDIRSEMLDDTTIAKGLKEALLTGTTRAVKSVSQQDGFFSNEMIKILIPERIRSVTNLLGKFGFQAQVDEFVLSMNRAAEKAAPKATGFFISALKEMTFDDARGILQGGNTAATEYLKLKTSQNIYSAFMPVVSSSMREVGVGRSYKQMMNSVESIPFGKAATASVDLDNYITTMAVDGLFIMLGEEEKKIRTNPAARGTELLRKVFGN